MKRFIGAFAVLTLVLSGFSLGPTTSAKADSSTCGPNPPISAGVGGTAPLSVSLDWPAANVEIKGASYIQGDLTPLVLGSNSSHRFLNLKWNSNDGLDHSLTVGFDCFNSGTAHNFFFSAPNAINEKSAVGIQNSQSCTEENFDPSGLKTYFKALCYANLNLITGHTYSIQIKNDELLGPSWFKAIISDLQNGEALTLGSIDLGSLSTTEHISRVWYSMFVDAYPSCDAVGIEDTVVKLQTIKPTAMQPLGEPFGFTRDICSKSTYSPNTGALGGYLVKYGGSNVSSRNLEGATVSGNSSFGDTRFCIPAAQQTFSATDSSNSGTPQNNTWTQAIAAWQSPTFTPTGQIGADITLLTSGSSNMGRYFQFTWQNENGDSNGGALGIECQNFGNTQTVLLQINSAIADRLVSNGTQCGHTSRSTVDGGTLGFVDLCRINYSPVVGHNYRLMVYHPSNLGSNWIEGSIEDLTTGDVAKVGDIETNPTNSDAPLRDLSFSVLDRQNYSDCTKVPIEDTIVQKVFANGQDLGKPISARFLGCPVGVITPNLGDLGGTVIKLGGADFATRNLEGAKPSTTPNSTGSVDSSIDVPKNLSFDFSGGVVHLSVDIPNLIKQGVRSVKLVSPNLGFDDVTPLTAVIRGTKATFSIPVQPNVAGTSVPIHIYAETDSKQSPPLDTNLPIPSIKASSTNGAPAAGSKPHSSGAAAPANQRKVPNAPTSPTYRLSGNQVLVSVTAPSATGATPSGALLIAPDLGFTPAHPVIGSLSGGKAIFRIVLSPSMAGKSAQVAIYLTNAAGSSEPLAGQVTLPPVIPGGASNSTPASQGAPTIKCTKGSITRTFSGSICPPGWK